MDFSGNRSASLHNLKILKCKYNISDKQKMFDLQQTNPVMSMAQPTNDDISMNQYFNTCACTTIELMYQNTSTLSSKCRVNKDLFCMMKIFPIIVLSNCYITLLHMWTSVILWCLVQSEILEQPAKARKLKLFDNPHAVCLNVSST